MYLRPIHLLTAIATDNEYGRSVITGIRQAVHDHPHILLRSCPISNDHLPHLLETFKSGTFDGIIVSAYTQPIVKVMKQMTVPVVNVSARNVNPLDFVGPDHVEVGRIAARHLLGLGMKHFLYAKVGARFASLRQQGFLEILRENGMDAEVLNASQANIEHMMQIVSSKPKPLGVFCCFDRLARTLLDRLIDTPFQVPDDVSVLGVDDAVHICEGGNISLSSIDTAGEQVGYKAVEAVVHWKRKGRPAFPILIPPGKVIKRDSTDYIAIRNPSLSRAVRMIRSHACSGIDVQDVVRASGLSRATLDRQLPGILGCSPSQEIRRLQLEHAEDLLLHSTRSVTDVAALCGFSSSNYFIKVFRNANGITPLQYRQANAKDAF